MKTLERIVITCGGTGGHFYPGLAIARRALGRGVEALLLLSGVNSRRQSEIAAAAGVESVILPEMPSPSGIAAALRFSIGFARGTLASRRELKHLPPEAVVGMGSFASLPVIVAATWGKIPVFLHDGNARIGRANRFLSRRARFLGAAFPPVNGETCRCPVIDVGMPVREKLEAARKISRQEAVAALNLKFNAGLRPELPTLLVFGGSQGAKIFNETVPEAITRLGRGDFQVLHLTGAGKLEATLDAYGRSTVPRLVIESDEEMEKFYGAADLVISRSGGGTVAELALFGKPALLVPYPFAAEGHQHDNARFYVSGGAGELIDNAEFTVETAAGRIDAYLHAPERLHTMSEAALKLARPDAAGVFLDLIAAELNGCTA